MQIEWTMRVEEGLPVIVLRIIGREAFLHPFTAKAQKALSSGFPQVNLLNLALELRFAEDAKTAEQIIKTAEQMILLLALSSSFAVLDEFGFEPPRAIGAVVVVEEWNEPAGVISFTFRFQPKSADAASAARAGRDAPRA